MSFIKELALATLRPLCRRPLSSRLLSINLLFQASVNFWYNSNIAILIILDRRLRLHRRRFSTPIANVARRIRRSLPLCFLPCRNFRLWLHLQGRWVLPQLRAGTRAERHSLTLHNLCFKRDPHNPRCRPRRGWCPSVRLPKRRKRFPCRF